MCNQTHMCNQTRPLCEPVLAYLELSKFQGNFIQNMPSASKANLRNMTFDMAICYAIWRNWSLYIWCDFHIPKEKYIFVNTMNLNIRMWSFSKNIAKHRTLAIVSLSKLKQWVMNYIFALTMMIQWSVFINAIHLSYRKKRFPWRAAWYGNHTIAKWL